MAGLTDHLIPKSNDEPIGSFVASMKNGHTFLTWNSSRLYHTSAHTLVGVTKNCHFCIVGPQQLWSTVHLKPIIFRELT